MYQRTRAAAACSGGKPESSRRAGSPAEAKVKGSSVTPAEQNRSTPLNKKTQGFTLRLHLDLLLQEVDLVLLLDQLLLLFSNLKHTHSET